MPVSRNASRLSVMFDDDHAVADASMLVAELLRRRGRELFARPELHCFVAEDQWDEARH